MFHTVAQAVLGIEKLVLKEPRGVLLVKIFCPQINFTRIKTAGADTLINVKNAFLELEKRILPEKV